MKYVLFICLILPLALKAQEVDDYVQSIDLKDKWFVFSEDYDSFVPYSSELHSQVAAHTLLLDKNKLGNYEFICEVQGVEHFLFLDGSLFKKLVPGDFFASKLSEMGNPESQFVEITFFGSNQIEAKKVFLGYKKELTSSIVSLNKQELYTMKRRAFPIARNVTIFSFIFVLLGGVLLSSAYPRAFNNFVDFGGVFRAKIREAAVFINRPFGRTNISFLGLLCIVTAFICWQIYAMSDVGIVNGKYLLNGEGFLSQLFNFLIFLAACIVLYFGKVIYMRLVGSIFGLGKLVDLHFFKLLQISLSILLPLSIILLGYNLSGMSYNQDIGSLFRWAVLLFYVFRMIIMLFTLNKNATIQFHYIITYLCIVELLPLILGLRFIV